MAKGDPIQEASATAEAATSIPKCSLRSHAGRGTRHAPADIGTERDDVWRRDGKYRGFRRSGPARF